MNKKIVESLFICSLIFLVTSTPIDSADDGNQSNGGGIHYTESTLPTGPVISTHSKAESQQTGGVPDGSGEALSTASTGAHITSTPSQAPLVPSNGTNTTAATVTTANTTVTPTPTPTTKTTSPVTTTTEVPTTTPTTTAVTTTTTIPPDTTKVPTTTVPSGTTTASAATTTLPTPTASPSKDRRFDGPSFIGGIVLSLGIMAIGFVAFKFYKARTERNYHTL